MLLINQKEISEALGMREAIEVVRQGYKDFHEGAIVTPDRISLNLQEYDGINILMPSYLTKRKTFGYKDVSVFFKNREKGKPVVTSLVLLHDAETGEPIMVADGNQLTTLKTGAATGVVTDLMAIPYSKTLSLIGTGFQAMRQLEAILTVRPGIEDVFVYDVDPYRCEQFVDHAREDLSSAHPRYHVIATPNEGIPSSDIITTVTTSRNPVFNGKAIKKGVHINAVGSFTPEMQEIDEYAIQAADKIIIDSRTEGLKMAGDLLVPMRKGIITENIIYAEVGEVLSGKKEGRVRKEEITLFESIGLAALDIAVAERIYVNAVRQGIGQEIRI